MKIWHLSAILIACVIFFSAASARDEQNLIINLTHYKLDEGSFFMSSYDNGVIKIKSNPSNLSQRASICWAQNASTDKMSNSTGLLSLLIKGEHGNEMVDVSIAIDGKIAKSSLTLSTNWEYYLIFINTRGSIDKICLVIDSFKNPVDSIIYIKEIKIEYGKLIDIGKITLNIPFITYIKNNDNCSSCPDQSNLGA
jgi:hypothetical protein